MKEKVLDVALDIECASLRGDAAILSIAAVPFYPKKYPNPFSESVFYEVINATSCVLAGFHFDEETIHWWQKQSDEAKSALLYHEPVNIGNSLRNLDSYLTQLRNDNDAELRLWAQGSDFDFPILKNAYKRMCPELSVPWEYWEQRDARTLILHHIEQRYGQVEHPYDMIPSMPDDIVPGVPHNALYDAHRTAWSLSYLSSCPDISEAHTSVITPKSSE